ncbi:MAG TPA: AAA family ATPase, partial [Bacteroidetes bacterium]|nr:AAA family ATPase [Bacteroidota bacterium]
MLDQQLTPRQIVAELDKYVISQDKAKKSVAIALRNRWRRQMVQEELREEIMPNNIIMIGPTGVGKTEIARRLARLARAPFIKVEATKFTEVGYVGRDVESMIRDLVDLAIGMVRSEKMAAVQDKAAAHAEERLLDILLPPPPDSEMPSHFVAVDEHGVAQVEDEDTSQQRYERSREKMREQLRKGQLDEREIELEVSTDAIPMMQVISPAGIEEMGMNLQDMFGNLFPKKTKKR